jgi:hypothetical protein
MVNHCLDEVAGGSDGQQHGACVVVPVDNPPFFLLRNANVRGQPQGFQPLQQALLMEGHYLRRPARAAWDLLPHPELLLIARVGELQSADRRYQREGVVAIPRQALLQCRADRKGQAAIPDKDQVGMRRHRHGLSGVLGILIHARWHAHLRARRYG